MGYCWCSKELEPDYVDCGECPFKQANPDTCHSRHVFHGDAVRECDDKRRVKGLPLLSEDFDLMKENFRKKELVEMPRWKRAKLNRVEPAQSVTPVSQPSMTISSALCGFAVCLMLGVPAAYVGQLLQLFTDFVFGILGVFFTSGPHPEVWSESFKDSFFYADFLNRYVYWASLILAIWSWDDFNPKFETKGLELYMRIGCTSLYVIIALLNFGLFISTIVGPLFIIFGLLLTAKR